MAKSSGKKSNGDDGEGTTLAVTMGEMCEPIERAKDFVREATRIVDDSELTGAEIQHLISRFHYSNDDSPYIFLERDDGEWPGRTLSINASGFAVITACLVVSTFLELVAASKARDNYQIAKALYWNCRYAWNMAKVTKVSPAAARSTKSAAASTASKASHQGRATMKATAQGLFLGADKPWDSISAAAKSIAPKILEMKVSRPLAKDNAVRSVSRWLSLFVADNDQAKNKLTTEALRRLKK